MGMNALARELKRGSTQVLVLALLEERERHGYEIARLIEERSGGTISFHAASLYPTLYRMEERDLIEGRWVEKVGQRRRRYYRLTRAAARCSPASAAPGTTSFKRSTASLESHTLELEALTDSILSF